MSNEPGVTRGSQPDFICGSNGDITTRKAAKKHEDHLAHNKQGKANGEDRHQKISTAAYYRFKKRGSDSGDAIQDWLEAELEDHGYL
jgi:hypothetical protein